MDAIAVHPYQTPETVVRSLTDLVALTKKYNHGKVEADLGHRMRLFAHDPTPPTAPTPPPTWYA